TDEFCAVLPDYAFTQTIIIDDIDPFPMIEQFPEIGSDITGTLEVTVTATDNSGNSASCSFMVTVIDDDAPIIDCPADITLTAPEGQTDMNVSIQLPNVDENCGAYTLVN